VSDRAVVEWDDEPGPGLDDLRHVAAGDAVGVGFLLAGPIAWLLPASADATLVAGYLTLLALPFAAVLLRYALVG
jgi:hypothetical protein